MPAMAGRKQRTTRGRPLSEGEWSQLTRGLAAALREAKVEPRIIDGPHPAAFLGALRFGSVPIVVIGQTIWWPGAMSDFAGTRAMGVLQHELQHVLDYANGRLSVTGYLLNPRNWSYRWAAADLEEWDSLGAEQRASMAEALWRAENSSAGQALAERLRRRIPWAT